MLKQPLADPLLTHFRAAMMKLTATGLSVVVLFG